jgi:hypothetical protein
MRSKHFATALRIVVAIAGANVAINNDNGRSCIVEIAGVGAMRR